MEHISKYLPEKVYKLTDRQGGGLKSDNVYLTKEAVREDLQSFHSIDVEGTEKMTLEDLLEIGDWELEEQDLIK